MKILIEFIDNSEFCSGRHDTRYFTLVSIAKHLQALNHKVYAIYRKNANKPDFTFIPYNDSFKNEIDLYIGHSVYKMSKERYDFFNNERKIPSMTYEAGWLYNSLVVDRKLFGDSVYYNKLANLLDDQFNEQEAKQYCQELITKGQSKWKQQSKVIIPNVPYIFIPGQVLHDLSITHYSKTDLKTFISKTLNFATKNNLHVIYKTHPGITEKEKMHGKLELEKFAKRLASNHKNFHEINTSIYDLMLNAQFTACVNAGSVVDNMVTQTPVYCCGESIFIHTGAVVHNENVEAGLNSMLKRSYDIDVMKLQQLKVIWWLKNNLLQEHLSVEENVRRLERHAGVKF